MCHTIDTADQTRAHIHTDHQCARYTPQNIHLQTLASWLQPHQRKCSLKQSKRKQHPTNPCMSSAAITRVTLSLTVPMAPGEWAVHA